MVCRGVFHTTSTFCTFATITRPFLYGLLTLWLIYGCSTSRHTTPAVVAPPTLKPASQGAFAERTVGKPIGTPGYAYVNSMGLNIETVNALSFKYAMQLDVPVELITNISLYQFIDHWMGAPYHLGGNDESGVDCSGFAKILEQAIYSIDIPRTSREQFAACRRVPFDKLTEGDLVFFGVKKVITHVGIYLMNNKFVHASTSGGVMISDLGEAYWSQRFRGAGRMP